jgi:hypothetical protein
MESHKTCAKPPTSLLVAQGYIRNPRANVTPFVTPSKVALQATKKPSLRGNVMINQNDPESTPFCESSLRHPTANLEQCLTLFN